MIRQIDHFLPGTVTRERENSSLALTRDENFDTQSSDKFRGGNQGIRKNIPVPMIRGKKLQLYASSGGYLKCHGMLISATPSLGDKVTCRYSGFTFLSIYLMVLSRSFTDHHLRCGEWLNYEFSKRGKTCTCAPTQMTCQTFA